ncbi:hypothetical protein HJC23_008024 [Cyclotella cryptica]|uniref:Glycosyltransferase 2-like domain-containing protein n=1 Tax=Cyclotella cryptica TaxID=29204 RepID=A0ABD3Q2R5_9STRA|eukprot:CCRYP_009149-RA/>CCRYP_009149-RA protein AED:0.09 eAED:0.09 QI:0/-1/0/1/-1/1/1/0/751
METVHIKQHTCIVNVGLYRSGTTSLFKAAEKLRFKVYHRFPDLPPEQLRRILHDPESAVQEWASSLGGLEEFIEVASKHDLICDGWIALLPFLPREILDEINKLAKATNISLKFVATSRDVESTVKSELQHWVIHDLEHQAGLGENERSGLEASLRARALQHQQHVVRLSSEDLVKLLPLATADQTWPETLSNISNYSAASWSDAFKDAGICNSNPSPPIEGILLTMRLGNGQTADRAIVSVEKLIDQIEQDHLCQYLVVIGIDADEHDTEAESNLKQMLKTREDRGQQMQSHHIIYNQSQPDGEPFALCKAWDAMAVKAWKHGADWVVLLGDDVEINCSFHYRAFYRSFLDISQMLGVAFGFGCPFWNDCSFPNFPTFPCVGKAHFKIFGGLIPEKRRGLFVNQDLDPYLHHLYLKVRAAPCVTAATLHNGVGGNMGSSIARYERVPADRWQDYVLSDFLKWIRPHVPKETPEDILLDVVVPSFRVKLEYLQSICDLTVPEGIKANFIIIIDNKEAILRVARDLQKDVLNSDYEISMAQAESILERELAKSGNAVRVRCNEENLGASASRNRGIDESAAEFVLNLDDDLKPDEDLLIKYGSKLFEIDHTVAGLIGLVRFPRTPDMPLRHAAILMSYLTFMFEIAERSDIYSEFPAWGVTANILFRRTSIRFDSIYAKTGGGEDVDYALRVTKACDGGKLLPYLKPGLFTHFGQDLYSTFLSTSTIGLSVMEHSSGGFLSIAIGLFPIFLK